MEETNITEFNKEDLEKFAKMGAKHFTKPPEMKEEDFVKKIKEEILRGGIQIKIRETLFTRKFA